MRLFNGKYRDEKEEEDLPEHVKRSARVAPGFYIGLLFVLAVIYYFVLSSLFDQEIVLVICGALILLGVISEKTQPFRPWYQTKKGWILRWLIMLPLFALILFLLFLLVSGILN